MGLDGHPDQGMIPPGAAQLFAELQARGRRPVVGRGEVVEHLPHHRPDAGLRRGLSHRVGKQIHVAEGGGAGEQHLGHRQPGAPIDKIAVDPAFGGEDISIQPFFQGQVVGQAAEQGHGGMGMGVDEAREDQALGVIQHPGRGVALPDLPGGPTATISAPLMATAPGENTSRLRDSWSTPRRPGCIKETVLLLPGHLSPVTGHGHGSSVRGPGLPRFPSHPLKDRGGGPGPPSGNKSSGSGLQRIRPGTGVPARGACPLPRRAPPGA